MSLEYQERIFISYSRVNKDFAVDLAKELKSSGFSVWLDVMDISTGARWDDEVEKALATCGIFMVILTPTSVASENVKDEIGYAIDHGKRIVPVLLESSAIPLRLRRFQYVDFTSKSYEDGVESAKQLLASLGVERNPDTGQFSEQSVSTRERRKDKPAPVSRRKSSSSVRGVPLILGGLAGVLLLIWGAVYFLRSGSSTYAAKGSPNTVMEEVQSPSNTETPLITTSTPTIPSPVGRWTITGNNYTGVLNIVYIRSGTVSGTIYDDPILDGVWNEATQELTFRRMIDSNADPNAYQVFYGEQKSQGGIYILIGYFEQFTLNGKTGPFHWSASR